MTLFSAPHLQLSFSAGLVLVSRLGGAAATVLILYILTQNLSPEEVGIIIASQAVGALAGLALTFNMEGAAIRFLPSYQRHAPDHIWGFLHKISRTAFMMSPFAIIIAPLYILFATDLPPTAYLPLLFIALMPLGSALLRSISLISHSLGQIQQSAFSLMGLRPLLYLFSLGIIASLGMMSVEMGLAASVFALAGAASYQLFFLKTILPARPKTPLPPNAEWQRTGLVLMLTVLFIDEFPNLVSLLASAALGEDDVAILAIALRVALLLRMITAATTMVISPKLSAYIGEGEWRPATQLTHQMVRLSALSIGGGSLILYLFAPFILSFFGGAYEEGVIILRLLIFIPLISAFFGPSLMILTAAGQTKIIFKTTAFALILLSFGTIISSPFGVMGVTLTLISIHFLWETSLFVAVWRQGFRPWLPHAILSLRKP